jgi:hypothetical protein
MVGTERHNETASRGARMLRTALGPAIASFLRDASVVEVMLNPDGRLWIDRLKGGLEDTGERLSPADGTPTISDHSTPFPDEAKNPCETRTFLVPVMSYCSPSIARAPAEI